MPHSTPPPTPSRETDAATPGSPILRAPDPRTARTRAAIVTGYSKLLREGNCDASVREVVAEAGISRASFYTHFSSVDEVALILIRDMFVGLADTHLAEHIRLGGRTDESVRGGQERLADAFWQHRDTLRPLMEGGQASAAYVEIVRAFSATIEQLLGHEPERMPAGIDPYVASVAIANTLVGLLTAWVTGSIETDRDTIVTHLIAMLPAWVSQPDSPAPHPRGGEN